MADKNPLKERSRLFLFMFTNVILLTIVSICWLLFWILISLLFNDWVWFSRSGSVLIIIGSLLVLRGTIRLTKDERKRQRHMTIIEDFTEAEKADQEVDSHAEIIGTVLMILGTLFWAYGDLL